MNSDLEQHIKLDLETESLKRDDVEIIKENILKSNQILHELGYIEKHLLFNIKIKPKI
jgi:hypothetical protein